MEERASAIERAVFGVTKDEAIKLWLHEHLRARLGNGLARTLFRSGRLAAVRGVLLTDGQRVVIKVHRPEVDVSYLEAAVSCQRRLADAGFPCPQPLDGPATTRGRTAVVETMLDRGEHSDGHDPRIRRAMASALFEQLRLLRTGPVETIGHGAPAWSRYEQGPWPKPHDPIFDFSTTPAQFAWLDELARRAAGLLEDSERPDWVGHVDWNCGNLRFENGRVSASYDWDSLAARPEQVLVGLSAGAFTSGSTRGPDSPTPDEVAAFLHDYEDQRDTPFSAVERRHAAAAATWVLAYNARCELSLLAAGGSRPEGRPLDTLSIYRDAYLESYR